MRNAKTGLAVLPCPLCAYANLADATRCARCGVPTDLVQCPNCDAVNRKLPSATCWRCYAALATVEPVRPRAFAMTVAHADRLGDIAGSYVGFSLCVAIVAFAGYRFMSNNDSTARMETAAHGVPAGIELLALAPPVALQFPPTVELEQDEVVPDVPTPTTIKPRRSTRSTQLRTRIAGHVVAAAPALSPDKPAVNESTHQAPAHVAAARAAPHSYCTAAALHLDQCRPEGLITGQ